MNANDASIINRSRVFRQGYLANVTITRPDNVAPYAAGDCVGSNGGMAAQTVTGISIATPGVVSKVAHGLTNGTAVQLLNGGTLPTGLAVLTTYYVVAAAADTFQLSLTYGGAAINTTGSSAGTHTVNVCGSAVITLPNMSKGGDVAMILSSLLNINLAAIPASMTSFRLHLYSVPPATVLVDNDVWALATADFPAYLGWVDLGTLIDVGPALSVQATGINKPIVTPGTDLYGVLVTNGGYTPVSNTAINLQLVAGTL